ncbi:DUF4810 domain-containing protein [Aestuariispira ectoiniformans]|uniref:DUF4810 domain-containing protein n=1 Tax=Aestuariispira ectoiniformans TaxID=2775080 RepID=UPI00223B9664|nr:DUF4810 domain-containing protein [Aestuariispira ectoiniformans]
MINNSFKKGAVAAVLLTVLVGCQTDRYMWGSYDQDLYNYYRDTEQRTALETNLLETLEKAEQKGKVPPGLYAEYGYLLMQDGRYDDARRYFELEKKLWPESTKLMDAVIRVTAVDEGNKDKEEQASAETVQ